MVTDLYKLQFNQSPSSVLHIDINSCFATIEQQDNPSIRGKPVVVISRNSPSGCVLAASTEAKKLGIKTGMRMKKVKPIYPKIIALTPNPDKYRTVHNKLKNLLLDYTDHLSPKSIDEFVLHLDGYPAIKKGLFKVSDEIKFRINSEIGEWITVSIGIGPNRFLAKTAAGLVKPNGLEEINFENYTDVFKKLELFDLHGINKGNFNRLKNAGISTVLEFSTASFYKLFSAFQSINAYYWYLRLRGWEIDDYETKRTTFSHSYVTPKPINTETEINQLLQKLTEKTAIKMRSLNYEAKGVFLTIKYNDYTYWGDTRVGINEIFDSTDLYKSAKSIIDNRPYLKPIRQIVVGTFNVSKLDHLQLNIFENNLKKESFNKAVDSINQKWGSFTIKPAQILNSEDLAPDSIAFGK